MIKISPIEAVISGVKCIRLDNIIEALTNKINEISSRRNKEFKTNFMRILVAGSIMLFITAYTTSKSELDTAETSQGIFIR